MKPSTLPLLKFSFGVILWRRTINQLERVCKEVAVAQSVHCPGSLIEVLSRTRKYSKITSVAVEIRSKQLADTSLDTH
jgi:hypothetical protein